MTNKSNSAFRQNRTKPANRVSYKYFDVNGQVVEELIVGKNGVTAAHIAVLHAEDDREVSQLFEADIKHFPRHIETLTFADGEEKEDFINTIADKRSSATSHLFDKPEQADPLQEKIRTELDKLKPKQAEAIYGFYYLRKSKVALAAELGVSEKAIRTRLERGVKALELRLKQ